MLDYTRPEMGERLAFAYSEICHNLRASLSVIANDLDASLELAAEVRERVLRKCREIESSISLVENLSCSSREPGVDAREHLSRICSEKGANLRIEEGCEPLLGARDIGRLLEGMAKTAGIGQGWEVRAAPGWVVCERRNPPPCVATQRSIEAPLSLRCLSLRSGVTVHALGDHEGWQYLKIFNG